MQVRKEEADEAKEGKVAADLGQSGGHRGRSYLDDRREEAFSDFSHEKIDIVSIAWICIRG